MNYLLKYTCRFNKINKYNLIIYNNNNNNNNIITTILINNAVMFDFE